MRGRSVSVDRNLAMEKRKIGLVSLLPAVYLQTLSSGSKDSPPEIKRT